MSEPPRYRRQTADARRAALIDAALRCLASGGLAGFTVDNISREAGVSRGLINHHFGGMDDLMVAAYQAMTSSMARAGRAALVVDGSAPERLIGVVDAMFSPQMFSRTSLRPWLALWGEVAVNPKLRAAHRRSYGVYRRAMAGAIAEIAAARGLQLDASALAATVIALIDGVWLEWCLDPTAMSRKAARAMVHDVLEARLGRLHA